VSPQYFLGEFLGSPHLLSVGLIVETGHGDDRDDLVGKRVRIRAIKETGSARVLNGLTGTVTALHPVMSKWYKIDLDPNSVSRHREWSIPADRLVVCENQ
jgi:hypothetical protein